MLTVCTKDYGEMTGSPHGTFYHLKVAVEYQIDVLPLQVEDYRISNKILHVVKVTLTTRNLHWFHQYSVYAGYCPR